MPPRGLKHISTIFLRPYLSIFQSTRHLLDTGALTRLYQKHTQKNTPLKFLQRERFERLLFPPNSYHLSMVASQKKRWIQRFLLSQLDEKKKNHCLE